MMTEQHAQPSSIKWSRVIAHVAGVISLLALTLAFFTFNAPVLLASLVLAIVGLVTGIRARAEIAITLAVLAVVGIVAFVIMLTL